MFTQTEDTNWFNKMSRGMRFALIATMLSLVAVITPAILQTNGSSAEAVSHFSGGGVTVKGKKWLDGKGVNVIRSRQCTELASRLYRTRGWGHITNFYGMKHNRKSGALMYKRNGSYVPVPGDVLVEKGGSSYNHVAVVYRVKGNKIYTYEQNATANGKHVYGWNKKKKKATGAYRNRHVGGFITSTKNPYNAVAKQKAAAKAKAAAKKAAAKKAAAAAKKATAA
ncbi:MAG: CHAP domain-containing protein [Candidatus Nanopelagicales bacterium]